MAERALGIDLGTTHSLVSVFEGGVARVLADELGRTLVPSVVALDDGGALLVGAAARERAVARQDLAVSRFKPDMGTERTFRLGPHALTPTALSGLVLRHLVATSRAALGEVVDRAVISVPAWFGERQRRATLDAAALAGLDVLRLVNEPTAAAIAHGLHQADTDPRTVVVLDLGGGTFDVTVLELFDGLLEVRASVGDVHLGGEDATDAVVELLLADASMAVLDPALRGRVRLRAERANRGLADAEVVEVSRAELDGGGTVLDRERFDRICAPLAARVRRLVREAMLQAALRPDGVDEVVLVGGAARMAWLARVAEEVLGRPPLPLGDVDHLVAQGAAIQAALVLDHAALRERAVTDVLTHSLGVSVQQTWGDVRSMRREWFELIGFFLGEPTLELGATYEIELSVPLVDGSAMRVPARFGVEPASNGLVEVWMEERPDLRDLARAHRIVVERAAPPGAPLVVPEPTLEVSRRRTRLDPDTLSPTWTLKEQVSRVRVAGHGETEVSVRKETTSEQEPRC